MKKENASTLITIIKITDKKYAEKLLYDGEIFMRKLFEYNKIEKKEVGDENEGLTYYGQASDLKIWVNGERIDIVNNVKVRESRTLNPYIYCMYGIYEDEDKRIENPYYLHKDCFDFGDTAVIILNMKEFIKRINEKINSFEHGLIKYVKKNSYTGIMTSFYKLDDFEHQREFRIACNGINSNEKSLTIKIGSIEDIAKICPMNKINPIKILDNN